MVHSENNWSTPPSKYQSIGQNTAVLDNETGVVHLLFTRINTEVFSTASSDHGATWAMPRALPDKPGCPSCWIAPSFSAIQLKYNAAHKGDLVACLDYSNLPGHEGGGAVERSGTLVSSDPGESWFTGATHIVGDECAVAELPNGLSVARHPDTPTPPTPLHPTVIRHLVSRKCHLTARVLHVLNVPEDTRGLHRYTISCTGARDGVPGAPPPKQRALKIV